MFALLYIKRNKLIFVSICVIEKSDSTVTGSGGGGIPIIHRIILLEFVLNLNLFYST